jgi:hypothetical protein
LLTRALTTGQPQFGTSGSGHYPELYANQEDLEEFARAMSGLTLAVAQALAAKFPWRQYETLIDIGTAEGCLPVQIALTHPDMSGGGFDLPPVGRLFDSYVQQHGLSKRLRFFDGDFLTDPLPRGDVLIFGRVLHNWGLATKKMLLKKAHDALPIGGAIIVYDRLIDDARRTNAAGLLASLNMLVMTAEGFDYSGAECIDWMRDAGFHDMRIEPLAGDQSMIVGYR